MTQPRKEQVKNLKTKFTLVDKVGTDSAFSSYDGGRYTIADSVGNTKYTDLLAKSVTGSVDGSEGNVRPTLWGGAGPYVVSAGQQFALTIPGVNGGNLVTVTIQASDLVLIGGLSRLTPARLVKLVNAALVPYGVTYPVASYELGRAVLRAAAGSGPLSGAGTFITLSDVTPGVCAAMGFGASPATSSGAIGPRRGIVTSAADGGGGIAMVRRRDGTPAVPHGELVHVGQYQLFPLYGSKSQYSTGPGPVYGRLVSAPLDKTTPNLVLSFFRKGVVAPSIVTGGADFASLTGAESITVTFTNVAPAFMGAPAFTATMAGVSSRDTFVDAVNSAWNAAVEAIVPGSSASKAAVSSLEEPYGLSGDVLTIKFQDAYTVNVTLTAYDAAAVVSQINAAIASAGFAAHGEAVVYTNPSGRKVVVIKSKDATSASQVVVSGDAAPKLGLPSGRIRGLLACVPDGANEARFVMPQLGDAGAIISISGGPATMAKLGFSAGTVAATAAEGDVPSAIPDCDLLIPEMMEFWDVPNDYDVQHELDASDTPDHWPAAPAGTGVAGGATASPLVDQYGYLLKALIPILDQLTASSAALGSGLMSTAAEALKARVTAPAANDLTVPTLILDIPSVGGGAPGNRARVYAGPGGLFFTLNSYVTATNTFRKDIAADTAHKFELSSGGLAYSQNTVNTAGDITWSEAVNAVDADGILDIGSGYTAVNPETHARVLTRTVPGQLTLLWSNRDSSASGGATRIYFSLGQAGSLAPSLWITHNAKRSAGNWTYDDSAFEASAFFLSPGDLRFYSQSSLGPAWSSWSRESGFTNFGNALVNTSLLLGNGLGDTLAEKIVPRIKMGVDGTSGSATTAKTLLFQQHWNSAPLGQGTIVRMYLDELPANLSVDSLVLSIVLNASWNGTQWTQDLASSASTMISFDLSGIRVYRVASGASPWADSAWSLKSRSGFTGFTFWQDGVLSARLDDSGLYLGNAAASPAANTLTQQTIPKAWGTVTVYRDGAGVLTITDHGSFNVSSYTVVTSGGAGLLRIEFSIPFLTSNHNVFLGAPLLNLFGALLPTYGLVSGSIGNDGTSYALVQIASLTVPASLGAVTGVKMDLNANNTVVTVSWAAFGTQ